MHVFQLHTRTQPVYLNIGRRLAVIDPVTLESRYFGDSESFALGEDGNLYYAPYDNKTLMYKISIRNADAEPPRSTGVVTPQPNAHGWLNADAVVRIAATDGGAGSGVVSVTYSAYGTQPAVPITVRGNTAAMTIMTEGVTSVIYGATDLAGSVEPPRVLAIRLDRTAPGIHFSGADAYTADQVVTIGCTATTPPRKPQ